MTEPAKMPPGFTGVGYPEVFTTMPPQPTEKKPGQMPPDNVKEFFEQGFTVVKDFFRLEEIEPAKQSFITLIDEIAQKLQKAGKITNLHEDADFDHRLYKLDQEWPGAAMILLKRGILTPAFRALWQHEKLLNAIEQLIGPDISANPIWNPRPKLPGHSESAIPMHQDSGYFDLDSYNVLVVTAWVAYNNVTEENGCLQILKGGHRNGIVGIHEGSNDFYLDIPKDELATRFGADPSTDLVNCEMKPGSVVFFSNIIPHCSLNNVTDHIRWGMDFRYQSPKAASGFFGLKEAILLRSPDKPDHVPDWDTFDSKDRYVEQRVYGAAEKTGKPEVDEFDTTVTGPWMEKWVMNQHNRHVDLFFAKQEQKAAESN